MSSDPRSGAPSHPSEADPASVVAERGAPLLEALDGHLPGARRHADATAAYAFAVAVELGLERPDAETVREAARLHDVGLVYVPASILSRSRDDLDEAERALLDSHLEAAFRLCRGAGIDESVCGWILRTRERYDGGGPDRLRGSEIPIEARIIRTACAGDLLLERAGLEATIAAVRAAQGTELDPVVSDAVIAVLERAAALELGRDT